MRICEKKISLNRIAVKTSCAHVSSGPSDCLIGHQRHTVAVEKCWELAVKTRCLCAMHLAVCINLRVPAWLKVAHREVRYASESEGSLREAWLPLAL